jgi:hypothetical protein
MSKADAGFRRIPPGWCSGRNHRPHHLLSMGEPSGPSASGDGYDGGVGQLLGMARCSRDHSAPRANPTDAPWRRKICAATSGRTRQETQTMLEEDSQRGKPIRPVDWRRAAATLAPGASVKRVEGGRR